MDASQSSQNSPALGWQQYHNLTTIYAWLDELVERYPDILTNYDFGRSYEGRVLRAVKVSYKPVWWISIVTSEKDNAEYFSYML